MKATKLSEKICHPMEWTSKIRVKTKLATHPEFFKQNVGHENG